MTNKIINTAFVTSLVSYLFFLLCEYLRPGFVSFVFSVHLFLIPIIIFGYLLARNECEHAKDKLITTIASVAIGLILMIVIWREGEVFGDMRVFMTIIGLFLPYLLSAVKED